MATFPSWINKKQTNIQNLSPRQVANKAYQLAIKKLDKDDKRKRPQYSVRERLLLSNTIVKAEEVLNKKIDLNRKVLSFDDDDILPPSKKQATSTNNDSSLPITASLVVAAYKSLQEQTQQQQEPLVSHDFCRPIMIPTSHSLTAII